MAILKEKICKQNLELRDNVDVDVAQLANVVAGMR
jgi:hypothetical protein